MKSHPLRNLTIAGAVLAALGVAAFDAPAKPKYTTQEVMQTIHKGQENIGKRVSKGEASKDDLAKMVEYYAALPLNDPPRGEKAKWLERTTALVKASQELKAGKADALDHYKAASSCKACHEAHKPEEKK